MRRNQLTTPLILPSHTRQRSPVAPAHAPKRSQYMSRQIGVTVSPHEAACPLSAYCLKASSGVIPLAPAEVRRSDHMRVRVAYRRHWRVGALWSTIAPFSNASDPAPRWSCRPSRWRKHAPQWVRRLEALIRRLSNDERSGRQPRRRDFGRNLYHCNGWFMIVDARRRLLEKHRIGHFLNRAGGETRVVTRPARTASESGLSSHNRPEQTASISTSGRRATLSV